MKKIIFSATVFLCCIHFVLAQNNTLPKKSFVFSAIRGTVSKPDSVKLPATVTQIDFTDEDSAHFKILSYKNHQLKMCFTPAISFIGIKRTSIALKNAAGKSIATIMLAGLSTNGLEGENEPALTIVADVLGYKINVGWSALANNALPNLQGDEIPSALFRKAGKGKVEMIPVARYSPDFELPFGYYINKEGMPANKQVGILAKAAAYPEHQCLFPAIASGSKTFDPGNESFGFYFTSPSHEGLSEDVWNMLKYPSHAVHATRMYPLKQKDGKLIPNSYLLCFEEAKNGDYNDYVFVVNNITPVTTDNFTNLFNGKNLNGWHTFLQGPGVNKDPNNNFLIEDGILHVVGQDLGYAITEKGYDNYHFIVEFKWGERKWGSRKNEKRDAGVCYNIPMNEPDSIWPQSIECQIQEGDVGDFWLLGFSTIKVNGIQNKPANHTRMIKQKDAEKPTGEWNRLEIVSYNGKCVHIVNGVIVNVGEEASVKSGRILLQSEYAEIYYRDVRIRLL